MARKFIASVLTAAIVITGFNAAPARADGRELAQAIAGIAAVAIIANALNDKRKKDEAHLGSRNTGYDHGRQHGYVKPQHGYVQPQQQWHGDRQLAPRPLPDRVARKSLPAVCLQTVEDRRGRAVNVLGQRCLQNNFRGAQYLPQSCAVDFQSHRGWRSGYDARCLSRAGYSIARR
jgi:hypothetical protein